MTYQRTLRIGGHLALVTCFLICGVQIHAACQQKCQLRKVWGTKFGAVKNCYAYETVVCRTTAFNFWWANEPLNEEDSPLACVEMAAMVDKWHGFGDDCELLCGAVRFQEMTGAYTGWSMVAPVPQTRCEYGDLPPGSP